MAFYSPPPPHYMSRPASALAVPRRNESLAGGAAKPGIFAQAADDLADARRVLAHGQEDDLRTALTRVIGRVEEMTTLLRAAHTKQGELETALTLARSNLQMAQANTDVLEDMLRRNAARRPVSEALPSPSAADAAKRLSVDSPVSPASSTKEEGGFFATFGRSRKPDPATLASLRGLSHTASASMPSLVADGAATKQIAALTDELAAERGKLRAATDAKAALEEELESLSQALFEEANKMVATERIRAAELREELADAARQKDALASALRIVETENGQLRARFPDSAPPSAAAATPAFEAQVLSRAPSLASLKAPSARPPRSPLRRAASLSGGSRPASPLVSSPLASRPPSIAEGSPQSSPEGFVSASLPNLAFQDATPPARAFLPDFTVQDATPPANAQGRPSFLPDMPSAATTPLAHAHAAPVFLPSPERTTPRATPMRRSSSAPAADDFHDPNLPDAGAPDPHAGGDPDAPLFRLPSLGGISMSPALASAALSSWLGGSPEQAAAGAPTGMARLPSLGGMSPALASASLSSWLSGSPEQTSTAPIAIPARPVPPAEESPWADVLSSARPALSRMSSMSSVASGRLSLGLERAKEVLAGLVDGEDDPSAVRIPPVRPRSDSPGSPGSLVREGSPSSLVRARLASFGTAGTM